MTFDMIAFKFFQIFLCPSAFLFILLAIGAILFKKKAGRILIIISLIAFYLFSITPVADFILSPLENKYQAYNSQEEAENIVLLISGVKEGEMSFPSKLTEPSLYRALEAVKIYFKMEKKPKIIISGSNPISSSRKPGEEISKFIQTLNVPSEDIILEQNSKNTYQAAVEVEKIIKQSSFILTTSAYHLPRSMYIFKKQGMSPIPAPGDFMKESGYSLFDFFPDPRNLRKSDLCFHEYFGLLYYWLRY